MRVRHCVAILCEIVFVTRHATDSLSFSKLGWQIISPLAIVSGHVVRAYTDLSV